MGKHDLKCDEIQVNNIKSVESDKIVVSNILTQPDGLLYGRLDLIPLWRVKSETEGLGTIPPWVNGGTFNEFMPVTYVINGVNYIFIAQKDGVTSQPTLTNIDWAIAGSSSIKPEQVLFNAATGGLVLDFTINNRQSLFPNPYVEVWSVSGDTDTLILGVGMIKNKLSGVIQTVSLDGIFGNGYINLINR